MGVQSLDTQLQQMAALEMVLGQRDALMGLDDADLAAARGFYWNREQIATVEGRQDKAKRLAGLLLEATSVMGNKFEYS